ncbi:amidohydrolase family protein [Vibrio mimicus]|uniref:amidohydrolase family protein n=1 Tax=Vibrio mimicus TaxID=674 RepID=UPI002F94418B
MKQILFLPILTLGLAACAPTSTVTKKMEPIPTTSRTQNINEFTVTECMKLPPLQDTSSCFVENGNKSTPDQLIIRGNVLTETGILKGGSVTIQNGKIIAVSCQIENLQTSTVITCPDSVITPGLINAHDHLTYNQNYPGNWGAERYDRRNQWRKGLDGHTKILAPRASNDLQVAWAEIRQIIAGTTSIAGSGGYKGFLRNVDSLPLQEGLTGGFVNYQTFPLGDSTNVSGHDNDCNYPKIVSKEVLDDLVFLPHVGEGVDSYANNEIKCLIGNGYPNSPGVNLAAENSTFIHAVASTAANSQTFKSAKMHTVWSPRSNISLYGNTAPITLYHNQGIEFSLSTDWTPSGSMNLFRELSCAAEFNERNLNSYFTSFDLWKMVTINAAKGLGFSDQIGSLKAGMLADIAIISNKYSGYDAVVKGQPSDVTLVIRGGKPLYGDANPLVALGYSAPLCEPINISGKDKMICVKQEIGIDLQTLMAVNTPDKSYPLSFTGNPKDEPTCLPAREGEYTGLSTSADKDGDGIKDELDNCPTIFNPVRPMDNGVQADADQDGLGDVCDPYPYNQA